MFNPNVTIADPNYLGRGVLLSVTKLGRAAVKSAIARRHMDDCWYKTRPPCIFLQGDWSEKKYINGQTTLMFIETAGPSDVKGLQYILDIMSRANDTNSDLHRTAEICLEMYPE